MRLCLKVVYRLLKSRLILDQNLNAISNTISREAEVAR